MKFFGLLLSAVLSVAFLADKALAIQCYGSEPFWSAEISDDKVVLKDFAVAKGPITLAVNSISGAEGYKPNFLKVYSNSNNSPVAIITSRSCEDDNDHIYPHEGIIFREHFYVDEGLAFSGSRTLYGCCGKGVPINSTDETKGSN